MFSVVLSRDVGGRADVANVHTDAAFSAVLCTFGGYPCTA